MEKDKNELSQEEVNQFDWDVHHHTFKNGYENCWLMRFGFTTDEFDFTLELGYIDDNNQTHKIAGVCFNEANFKLLIENAKLTLDHVQKIKSLKKNLEN